MDNRVIVSKNQPDIVLQATRTSEIPFSSHFFCHGQKRTKLHHQKRYKVLTY